MTIKRDFLGSIRRGLGRRCPSCGIGAAFSAYLKVADTCDHCGEPLGQIRADDMPPYVTIVIVGHIVVALALFSEQHAPMPLWIAMVTWPVLALALTLWWLPFVKGGCVGAMWALRLRGDERQGSL